MFNLKDSANTGHGGGVLWAGRGRPSPCLFWWAGRRLAARCPLSSPRPTNSGHRTLSEAAAACGTGSKGKTAAERVHRCQGRASVLLLWIQAVGGWRLEVDDWQKYRKLFLRAKIFSHVGFCSLLMYFKYFWNIYNVHKHFPTGGSFLQPQCGVLAWADSFCVWSFL